MNIVTDDALERAVEYYGCEDETLLSERGHEFVDHQKYLTAYLLEAAEAMGIDASEVLMNAAVIWKAFTESGFSVPEIPIQFIERWDKQTETIFGELESIPEDKLLSPQLKLECLLWQPVVMHYFLSTYFGDDYDTREPSEETMDAEAAQFNILATATVEIIHRAVNHGILFKA